MTIEEQRETAADLRDILIARGFIVLGLLGGAPRDWSQGRLARDLDFYVRAPHPELRLQGSEIAGVDEVVELGEGHEGQDTDLECVQEFFFQGVRINLIYSASLTSSELIANFSVSISKAYYDFDNSKPVLTKEARLSFATEILVVNQNPEAEGYINKICSQFPHMRIGTSVDMAYCCMDMVLMSSIGRETTIPGPMPAGPLRLP